MTLMRIHCPVCAAALEIAAESVAAARQTRCGQCGLLFVPPAGTGERALGGPAGPRDRPSGDGPSGFSGLGSSGQGPPAPMPPSVIYLSGDAPCVQAPPLPPAPSSPVSIAEPAPSGAAAAQWTVPSAGGLAGDFTQVVLGSPPPYLTIPPQPRPPRTPVEMAPMPPPAPLNIRTLGALGPPPPYRPIIQAGAVFFRGPAPDLEPWRLASLARVPGSPGGRGPEGTGIGRADWSLHRESEPVVEADFTADQSGRSEFEREGGSRIPPMARGTGVKPPRAARLPVFIGAGMPRGEGGGKWTGRGRRWMWAAGTVAALLAGGVTVYAERGPVRRIVATFRSNAVPAQASDPAPATRRAASETEGADKCVGDPSGGTADSAERQDNGCGNSQSATIAK